MRLICTVTEQELENPYAFSYYLASQGIENQCEEEPEGKGYVFRIWVIDEDLVDKALQIYREYQANPHDPRFKAHATAEATFIEEPAPPAAFTPQQEESKKTRSRWLSPAPYGPISTFILFIVIALFVLSQMQRETYTPPQIPGVVQAPLLSPTEKALLYDYPAYFVLRDALLKEYTAADIEEKKPPSPSARALFEKLISTPVWMGAYERYLNHLHNPNSPLNYHGPLFEKIRQGEAWRLFTPCLLHVDLLHIFFNVLWLILLGNQIEFRLGKWRYLLLILVTGIVSNTAQYLVGGPFFMGLSGIVVGMAAFIWARQQRAPWEGYLLNRFTLIFLGIFVVGMFSLQLIFFIMQMTGSWGFSIGIANTAHLSGAVVGYLLGRLPLFAIHHRHKS